MRNQRLVRVVAAFLRLLGTDLLYRAAVAGPQGFEQLPVAGVAHHEALPSSTPKPLVLDLKDRRRLCGCPRLVTEHQRSEVPAEDGTHRSRRLFFGIEMFLKHRRCIRTKSSLVAPIGFAVP